MQISNRWTRLCLIRINAYIGLILIVWSHRSVSLFAGRARCRTGVERQFCPTEEQLLSACPSCHRDSSWECKPSIRDTSTVFLMLSAEETEFLGYRCTTMGCIGTLQCDGYEQCFLRYTAKWAWSWELLREYWDRVAMDGESWHGFWKKSLMRYKGCA